MLILHRNPRIYEDFPVSPSAFRFLQTPLDALNKKYSQLLDNFISDPQLIPLAKKITMLAKLALLQFHEGNYSETDKRLKEMFFDITTLLEKPLKLAALFYATTALLIPITCLTPVSFAIDLFSGVLEVRQAFREGYPKDKIDEILRKKWLASAAQHAAFFTMNFLYFRATFLGLRWTVIVTPILYPVLQTGFFVFTNRFLEHQEWSSKQKASFKSSLWQVFTYRYPIEITHQFLASWVRLYPIFSGELYFEGWEVFDQKEREALVVRNDESKIDKFLQRYKNKVSPLELLELNPNYTEEELKKAYKKWARHLHPDKQDPDGQVLFKGLLKAYELLGKHFNPQNYSKGQEDDTTSSP